MSDERATLVAKLVGVLGEVNGRKRLQKIVHLLQVRGYREFSHSFDLHYYGPYSRELAGEIDFLCKANVLRQTKSGDAFQYKVNDAWRDRIQGGGQASKPERWFKLSKELNREDVGLLEAVSTIAFLSKVEHHKGPRLQTQFRRLKPNLKSYYPHAVRFAKQYQLCGVD